MTTTHNQIALLGCSPTSLASYIKSLGVFRLAYLETLLRATGCRASIKAKPTP